MHYSFIALCCFGKLHVYKMLMHYLPPAHSSFSSSSTQFIPVLGLHIYDLLINFFHCLVFFHFLLGGFFSCLFFICLCGVFFSMLTLFPLSFSSSFHFKTDHIFPFNFFLKLLSFSFTKMVIPLRGQRKFSLLFYFLK